MNKKQIPLSVPNLDTEIVDSLRECIETGWVSTGGRFITEFEQKIARYVGANDAVSTQSGTAGLHTALRILGVKPGDEVIVPTLTFIAAVNPVKYMGAEPVFMDCDDSLCIDPYKLEEFCEKECDLGKSGLVNKKTGKRVAAIVIVHVFGNMADMPRIMSIAAKYDLRVLEDATEALGSYFIDDTFSNHFKDSTFSSHFKGENFKGRFAGTIGDMGVYSFNANKIITTGGGGMVVSNNQKYLDEARYLSITAKNDSLYFVHDEVGYNYRMLNIQAALGVSQIDKLERFIETKMSNYELYKSLLSDTAGIYILPFDSKTRSNHWFYSLLIDESKFGKSRDALMHQLIDKDIQCRPVWKLCHTQKPYIASPSYKIEKAKHYANNILNVPCSTNLTPEDVRYVCECITDNKKRQRP